MLLVHDEASGVEHLVREVAFANVQDRFGFVVPLPSKPTVAPVESPPWANLEVNFRPFRGDAGAGSGQGFGSGLGRLGGVHVHEAKRVGSFASFVLSANEPGALPRWLKENHFETTPASAAWLERYVKRGFFFVALRFEPSLARERHGAADHDPTSRLKLGRAHDSETLRITFDTPVPYYPYEEPDREDLRGPRALVVWLVTKAPKIPVTLGAEGYVRPWREGQRYAEATADQLEKTLQPRLWGQVRPPKQGGEGPWVVQTFEDQKGRRTGFGDVVLLPEKPAPLEDAAFEKRKRLLGVLDPALEAP